MSWRKFVFGIAVTMAAGMCEPSQAQQATKQKIGYLVASSEDRPAIQKYRRAFVQSLASFGYVENIEIEYRFAELDFERLPSLAAELVALKVDVIVANPTAAAVAAKKISSSIPIVMINAGDPVARGLVASLARPGGNVTGLSFSAGLEHFSKAMELLKEAVPSLRKVGILVNPAKSLPRRHRRSDCQHRTQPELGYRNFQSQPERRHRACVRCHGTIPLPSCLHRS
jgi:putative tryptophan/tyrosine transport system substrate-binding protein